MQSRGQLFGTLLSALVLLLSRAHFARAADASLDWSAGVASVKITPDKPIPLAGYASRTKPFETVDQDIYAKALALQDAAGHRAVLITMDLCVVPQDVANQIRERIARSTHLDPAAIVLNFCHSHSTPAVSLGGPTTAPSTSRPTTAPFSVDPVGEGTIAYTRWLQDRTVECAESALAHLAPARLSWGTGVADFAMNRREFTERGVILGVNPRGLVDRTVPVLRIDAPDGKPRAIVFGYACHGTTMPPNHLGVSADFAGYARAWVEQQFPGAEAMFVMGCGGDANPYPRVAVPLAKEHGDVLGREVCRVMGTKLRPVHSALSCAEVTAQFPLLTPAREELETASKAAGVRKDGAREMLHAIEAGDTLPAFYRAPVSAWQFADDLTFVALPDEVVVSYVPHIERAAGPLRLWVAGYCNEVAGYIPDKDILREGGYETRGLYFDAGWFAPGVEEALVKAARESAEKAGRHVPGE